MPNLLSRLCCWKNICARLLKLTITKTPETGCSASRETTSLGRNLMTFESALSGQERFQSNERPLNSQLNFNNLMGSDLFTPTASTTNTAESYLPNVLLTNGAQSSHPSQMEQTPTSSMTGTLGAGESFMQALSALSPQGS